MTGKQYITPTTEMQSLTPDGTLLALGTTSGIPEPESLL